MVQNKLSSAPRPEFLPRSIIRMLWKHKLALVTISLVLSAISVGIVLSMPAIYRAEALILVHSQKIPEKYVAPTVATDLQDRLATLSQQILSNEALKKVIDDFDLYREEKKSHVQEEIIEMMRHDIQISLEKSWTGNRPGAFRISYQGPVPATVAEVANRIANKFIEANLRSREEQAVGTSDFLKNELDEAKKNLDKLEAAVSKYKIEHNGELPQQEGSLNGTLQRLQLELQGNQEAVNRAQQTKVILENALGMAESAQATLARAINEAGSAESGDSGIGRSTASNPRPAKPSEILQQQLDSMRLRYSDDHPDVKRMREAIVKAKAAEATMSDRGPAIQSAPSGSAPVPTRRVSQEAVRELAQEREKASNLAVQLKAINQELEVRAAERKRILEGIGMYQGRVERLPVREQEMEGLTRDYENSKAEYKSLLDKKTSAEMATEMERRQKAERFELLDAARVPELPFSPNRPRLASLGIALSLALGFAFAIGMELRRNRLLGEWELPAGVVTIGRVPVIDFSSPTGKGRHVALLSSALLSLIGIVAAGLYYAWHRL